MLTRNSDHEYFWHGRRVPGVTSVLTAEGFIDSRWFTEESRHRGTYVHAACQFMLEDDLAWSEIEPAYLPWIESFAKWRDAVRPEVIALETMVRNPVYGYAGTPDWVLLINGDRWLIDGKTGAVAPWVGLQTAAYAECLDFPVRRAALKLRADGEQGMVVPLTHEQDWHDFLCALGCYQAKHRLRGGKG